MSGKFLPFFKDIVAMNLGRNRLFRLIFMVTSRCPLKCRICGIWKGKNKTDPSLQDMERFFSSHSFSWINLTGGEIFMRRDMPELFQLIAQTQTQLRYLTFPTTGYLVDRTLEGVEAALRNRFPRLVVTVSFDGGKESHDSLREGDRPFEKARETYRALKKLETKAKGGLQVIPGLTLSSELLSLGPDPVGDLARELALDGRHEVHLNLAHCASHYYRNPELEPPDPEAMVAYLRKLLIEKDASASSLKTVETLYLKGAIQYLRKESPPLSCKACDASVFIDSEWNLYPCTHFPFKIGSLEESDHDLTPWLTSDRFREAKAKVRARECPGCWTPCEAFTAIAGSVMKPSLYRLATSAKDAKGGKSK